MSSRCSAGVLQMFSRCSAGLLQMFSSCFTDVQQLFYTFSRCSAVLLQMFSRCSTDALQVFSRYVVDVLPVVKLVASLVLLCISFPSCLIFGFHDNSTRTSFLSIGGLIGLEHV